MNKHKSFLLITGYLFILNIIFSCLLFKDITTDEVIYYLLESITLSGIINIISNIPKKEKTKKIIEIITITIISLLYMSQYVHFHFYDCFYSIYSLTHGSQILGYTYQIIKVIIDNIKGFLVLFILLLIMITIIIKIKEQNNKNRLIYYSIITIISIALTITGTYIHTNDIYSRKNILKNTNTEVKNVKKFGLITGMAIDTYRYKNVLEENLIKDKNNYEFKKEDLKKYNVEDLKFEEIKTNDNSINALTNYLKSENPTNKNEYTGIFKNKNLIFITAESFSFSAIDKDLTPTLYKLTTEGFNFTNFYTPIYYSSTADGEYTNLTGLLPKEGIWGLMESQNKYFPYTYGNIFNKSYYQSNSFHNGVYTFYQRNKVMPNLGYSFKACGNGLEKSINCDIFPQSDLEMMDKTYKYYKYSDKFNIYYMSISGHLPHNFKTNDIAIKNQKEVKNIKHIEPVKAYIAQTIELDKAVEKLLKNLQASKKLDNTVIVLLPDHYPYGLSEKELKDLKEINTEYDKHKSGLIIYNTKTKGKKIDKYASNIDVLPTILNMFGMEYDSRLIIGKDIMSSTDGIVIFNDRSFLTNKGYYNENTNKFTNTTKEKVNNKYIEEKRLEVYNKVNASSLIIQKDYYKYIK